MAKENKYEKLAEIDYCIRQYFSKYMSSTIAQEKKKLKSGQTLDDMMAQCQKRWGSDAKFKKDTQTFVNEVYKEMIPLHGGKGSKELKKLAEQYVLDRYECFAVEQLAREKVPTSSAEYIAKTTFNNTLIGLGVRCFSKSDAISDKVDAMAEEMYNPSAWEQGAAFVGSTAIDAVTTGGAGGAVAAVSKGVVKKAAIKIAATSAKGFATDVAITAAVHGGAKLVAWDDKCTYSEQMFGDANAVKEIQDKWQKYKKKTPEYITTVNGQLNKKIKTAASTYAASNTANINKVSNSLLAAHKGDSAKLVNTIKANLTKQCVTFNQKSTVPSWMFSKTAADNRYNASRFYAFAMDMSAKGKREIVFGKKKMTVQEVAQRAYDYARAADMLDKKMVQPKKESMFSAESQKAIDDVDKGMAELNALINQPSSAQTSRTASSHRNTTQSSAQSYNPYAEMANSTPATTTEPTASAGTAAAMQQNSTQGWGETLEQLGLSGFGDISKNLGYVIAMLPDMMIGMLTGKNPNMKLNDNLMPLAAIVGGMFIKNPLLKLLLMGYGGASLFKNAGNAALGQSTGNTTTKQKVFKQYDNDFLDKRITNPVIKGDTMICNIDGKPLAIKITSTDALDAYEQGSLPLNTLANAVLRKYDENNSSASQNYAMQQGREEELQRQRGLR